MVCFKLERWTFVKKEPVVNEMECVDAPRLVPRLVSVIIGIYGICSKICQRILGCACQKKLPSQKCVRILLRFYGIWARNRGDLKETFWLKKSTGGHCPGLEAPGGANLSAQRKVPKVGGTYIESGGLLGLVIRDPLASRHST